MIPALYHVLIALYGLSIRIASLFSQKARHWISGRHHLFTQLASAVQGEQSWIWVHVSSLGEFEQGRPEIEYIKQENPHIRILLTFFSPSGYLLRRDYAFADYVTYIPLDTWKNAKRFIEIVRPLIAVFVKYDLWYNHLSALEDRNIPTFLISAHLRAEQIYFKRPGRFIENRLKKLACVFTQTASCRDMLISRGFDNVVHAGDTRLDRVLHIADTPHDVAWLKKCLPASPVLVAGSTWPEDESILLPVIKRHNIALLIAPHEVHEARLQSLAQILPDSQRLSHLKTKPVQTTIVIVDTIGDLAHLYAIGDLAYVGGGFGKGIHNILEPVAHGLPVIIGPRYHKFPEAETLVREQAVRSVTTSEQAAAAITDFTHSEHRRRAKDAIQQYIQEHRGATQRIYLTLEKYLHNINMQPGT